MAQIGKRGTDFDLRRKRGELTHDRDAREMPEQHEEMGLREQKSRQASVTERKKIPRALLRDILAALEHSALPGR